MNRVPIVFCFDDNYSSQAAVAIASLLYSKNLSTEYVIYCVVPKLFRKRNENKILKAIKDETSVKFVRIGDELDKSYETRGITSAAYYRLAIHYLLENEKKVLYSDVDVLFVGDLYETYTQPMNGKLIGAVKSSTNYLIHEKRCRAIEYWSREFNDVKDKYVNSGFLLMNLTEIRRSDLGRTWIEMSKKNFVFQDQDIINITCKHRILFLPPTLCRLTYASEDAYLACIGEVFSEKEVYDALKNPVIFHYAGQKPWNYRKAPYANLWWSFLKNQPNLYLWFACRYIKNSTFKKLKKLLESLKYSFN